MGQIALVTGASSGIGFELAQVLAKDQYDLILVARTRSKLDEMANDLCRSYGIKAHVIACDLSISGSCGDIYRHVREKDLDVDVLVNNAGLGDCGAFVDSSWKKQEQILQLNTIALTQLTHLFLPGMLKRRRGKILNVASTAAFQPGPLMSVYYATKAYVLSFSSAITQELKGTGVTVTCLCPGPTASGFQAAALAQNIRLTQGRRLPSSQEVAAYGYRAMVNGKTVAVHGFLNRIMVFGVRFLPQWVILRFVHFMQAGKL